MKKNLLWKVLALSLTILLMTSVFVGCADNDTPVTPTPAPTPADPAAPATPAPTAPPVEPDPDYVIRILTVSHSGELIPADHPAIRQLEELTGYTIELEMILNADYEAMMNTRLTSRDLPGIVVITGNSLPIVQAAQGGAFWDLTDHLPQWEHLAAANQDILRNVSIGGRNFGMYRERPIGRQGITYRSDWLEDLGLPVPSNLDQMFETLVAFTDNNPEPNGGNTFGMAWTGGHMGPFHDLVVMHGGPNRWSVEGGTFVPWFEHAAFEAALDFSRRLYLAGAINEDFAALPTGDWAGFVNTGLTGWHMDVSDQARRTANQLRDNGFMTQEELDAGNMVWVLGAVANSDGRTYIRATPGNAGYVAISTIGAPTEDDLMHHLNFLNIINSPKGQTIVSHGAEGYNWEYVGDRIRLFTPDEIAAGNEVVEGLNQFMMRNNEVPLLHGVNSREDAITAVQAANVALVVNDPALPLVSEAPTWVAHSGSLNRLIDDAVINFVMGNINMDGFRAEVARWYAEGGQDAINEFTAAYNR